MKKIIIFLLTLLPLSTFAQDVWERPQDTKQEVKKPKQNEFNQDDAKYLAGTVPEIDGKVVFTLDLNLPGRSAQDIYERVYTGFDTTAEKWITDAVALNKRKTRLSKGSAKFRRKTIDRKDEIFSAITNALK